MPIALTHIREQLLPGLMAIQYSFAANEKFFAATVFNGVTVVEELPAVAPVSLPVAAAMGAVAVVIKNPVVSRHFWSGW